MREGYQPQPNCITPKYISSILFPADTNTSTVIGISWIPSNASSAKIVKLLPLGSPSFNIDIPLTKSTLNVIPIYYFDGALFQYNNKPIKDYCSIYSTIAIIELTY